MKITASDIKRLIRARYSKVKSQVETAKWVVLSEVRTNTGFKSQRDGEPFKEKFIDIMAFNCWPSEGLTRVVFEIKTSRNDFLNELKRPEKRWLAMMYSHRFYYVAPEGVVDMRELPTGCGLVEVLEKDGKLKLHTVLGAPRREASPLPDSFIASLLRSACKAKED